MESRAVRSTALNATGSFASCISAGKLTAAPVETWYRESIRESRTHACGGRVAGV